MKYIYLLFLSFSIFLYSGCSYLGMENMFSNDPLTGGVNAAASQLLGVPLPAGLQVYPSHGFISNASSGMREGLETYRGHIDGKAAAIRMFNVLQENGWHLRLSLQMGYRSVAVYEKNGEMAVLTFHRQGLLTILEIWAGPRLEDGASLSFVQGGSMQQPDVSIAGEEYGPLEEKSASGGAVETWGNSGKLEERDL